MDDTMRKALEAEFDEKSTELSAMMEKIPEMQEAYQRYEAAVRAQAVKELENAAKEETAEMERMLARCRQAQSDLNAATQAGDPERIKMCKEKREDEHLAFELAERRMQDARRRYQAAVVQQGFGSEDAYRQAFLAKPAFMKLEKQIQPFRMEYAELFARCEEIEKLLSGEEDI